MFSRFPGWLGREDTSFRIGLLVVIILTLWDFVVEDWIRSAGRVYRVSVFVMHGIMGIRIRRSLAMVPVVAVVGSKPTSLANTQKASREFDVLGGFLTVWPGVLLSGVPRFVRCSWNAWQRMAMVAKESVIAENE